MIMKKTNKRLLAVLLTLVMVFGLLPAHTFAMDDADDICTGYSYAEDGFYTEPDIPEADPIEVEDDFYTETDIPETDSIEEEVSSLPPAPELVAPVPFGSDADVAIAALGAHTFTPVVQGWVTSAANTRTLAIDQVRAQVNALLGGLDATAIVPAPVIGVFPNPVAIGVAATDRTFVVNVTGDDGSTASTTITANIEFLRASASGVNLPTAPLTGRNHVIPDSTLQFNATVLPAGLPPDVAWSVTGDPGASISVTGLLTVEPTVPVGTVLTVSAETTTDMGANALPVSNTVTINVVDVITVYVSVEAFTIGHGFIVEPTPVRIPSTGGTANMNVMLALHTLLEGTPYAPLTPAGAPATTALGRIGGVPMNPANPPQFMLDAITAAGTASGTFNPNATDSRGLGNGDFGMTFAGWMFSHNHLVPSLGASSVPLSDGSVVRWMFTLLGNDIGIPEQVGMGFAPPVFMQTDKTALTRALFDGAHNPTQQARDFALDVIINPLASAVLVSDALAWLEGGSAPNPAPIASGVVLNRSAWNNAVRGQTQTFTARVVDQFGADYPNQNVTWTLVPGGTVAGGPTAAIHQNTTYDTGVVTIYAQQMGGAMVLTATSAADPAISATASVATPRPGISLLTAGQPTDVTVTRGIITESLTVTANATGLNLTTTPLTFQWFSNTTATNTGGTPIDGATSASFAIPTGLTTGTHYFYVAVSTALGTVPVNSRAVTVTVVEPTITVYMSFEGFNLGHGFYIEPTQLHIPVGSSAMDATSALLTQAGHLYSINWGLDRIENIHPGGLPNPPSYITVTLDPGPTDGSLGSGDYSPFGGWLNTVNHTTPQVGADALILSDGDVIRWQFSVQGWGGDLGMPDHWETPLYDHADKTVLIRALFAPGADATQKAAALAVIIDPLATSAQVDAAIEALLGVGNTPPAHKAALNAAILQAQARQVQNYTAASWATLQTALGAAIAVAGNANATQQQVNDARNTLMEAIDGLRTVPVEFLAAKHGALSWLRANHTNPGVSSEWAVLALARAGIDDQPWYDLYLANLEAALTAGNVVTGSLDFSRVTLAVTALGEDATAFGTASQDLTAIFRTFSAAPTINAHIFALIALDADGYFGDRQQHKDAILAAQGTDGSWSLTASATPTEDLTAMALQALAPYYDGGNGDLAVVSAVQDALDWLPPPNMITDPESLAQVIVALTALGYDAGEYVVALMGFIDPTSGGFRRAGMVNAITTEQAAHALVAYWRFMEAMDSLYDMNNDAGPPWTGGTMAVSRVALNNTIAAAEGRNQASYTTASWTAMQNALTAARAVHDDAGATQIQVDAATNHLQAAINALAFAGGGVGNGGQPARAVISVTDPGASGAQTSVFFAAQSFDLNPNETVYSLLRRTGLTIVSTGSAGNQYVRSINGWGEFSDGPESGWMFRVNGIFPVQSAGQHVLRDGDRVEWLFSRNLGADLPGAGGQEPVAGSREDDENDEDNEDDDTRVHPFVDLSRPDAWYANAVQFMFEHGLMQGVSATNFDPQGTLTRAQVATILHRLAEAPTATWRPVFSDVPSDAPAWYRDAVIWAYDNDIVQGAGGRFDPYGEITREQFAAMLYRYARFAEVSTSVSDAFDLNHFPDRDQLSVWAETYKYWANYNELIQGMSAGDQVLLAPGDNVTRAQSAMILMRFIVEVY